jgi:CHAT domain-containing protein/tetratricopeptide (TPR) repeat protein
VKRVAAIVIGLCGGIAACSDTDTARPEKWQRGFEARLSGPAEWRRCTPAAPAAGRIVENVQCGTEPPPPESGCGEAIHTHADARRLLALYPHCTDQAISTLERLATIDPAVRGDLAAAYYSRAQRDDRALDLLRALRWAREADPRHVETHFNRALVQHALGLTNEAVASWDEVIRRNEPHWADEARRRRAQILAGHIADPVAQWSRNRDRLANALKRGERATVARLIAPFPTMALRHFEEEPLPPAEARLLAEELSRGGDRYALDVVQSATPETLATFRRGRRAYYAREWREAAASFERAAAADGALQLAARLASLIARYQLGPVEPEAFDPLIAEAAEHHYTALEWRSRVMRAVAATFASRYVEALAEYDAAVAVATKAENRANSAATHARRSGVLRIFGDGEGAWRDALAAVRLLPFAADPQNQHTIRGEVAAAIRLAGDPFAALSYQDAAVREIRRVLTETPGAGNIRRLQYNLSVALRERASFALELERFSDAARDLAEATRLSGTSPADVVLSARIDEVTGQSLLRTYPAQAAARFTEALARATGREFGTVRVRLLTQRADARRRAGDRAGARTDLQSALAELRREEELLLSRRTPGEAEELWSSYFRRFLETYQLLIRQLIEEGREREAFEYAERARAFEPLNLVLRTPNVSPEFRATASGGPVPLARIQALLPVGTVLVQYSVQEDRTYAWIVSRSAFQWVPLRARHSDVERWTAAVQEAVRQRNAPALVDALVPPYDGLVAEVLGKIGRTATRLVFVPDGAMHGLPIAALRNPRTNRFLVQESVPLEFAASATLYLHSLDRSRKLSSVPRSVLLVGNPAFDRTLTLVRGMEPLPHAEDEVRKIAALYGPSAEMLMRAQATVPEFLELARDRSIVHFAGHVIANPREPSRSLLLFARSAGHSGVLTAEELLTRLKLDQTKLVVLSACSSAGGLPVGPEGVAPLVRPLIAAGVPAVIGSLWDVGDATAEELLVSFHRRYEQEGDAAEALRSAQLAMLGSNNPGLQSVLAWAPFQVIGHTSSPDANTHQ